MKNPKISVDDGSTNIKISYIKEGELLTYICSHSFAKDHQPASGDQAAFNVTIESNGNKLHYTGSSDALSTTNSNYQESDINLAAIHYALLNAGIGDPNEIPKLDLVVTLPITKYYDYRNGASLSKNLTNIESKKKSILRKIELNNGIETEQDTNIYQTVKPFIIENVEVMPEGIPAILTSLYEAEVDEYTQTIVVDLGGSTCDGALILGELSTIKPCGYEDVNVGLIIDAIRNSWGANQSQARVSHLIAHRDNEKVWEKTFRNPEKREKIKQVLKEETDKLAQKVVKIAKELHESPDNVFVVGGGATLIIDALKEEFKPDAWVKMIENPQTALAREIAIYHDEDNFMEE